VGIKPGLALRLYALAWWFAKPLVLLYLQWRTRKNSAYALHHNERWGEAFLRGPYLPSSKNTVGLIWLHAVSLGETRAAQPLILQLLAKFPQHDLLLSHMTPTGREAGAQLVESVGKGRIFQCYLPYDTAKAQTLFLEYWKPKLGIIMETEVWPQLCFQAQKSNVPLLLVNARLSEKSLRKAERWSSLIKPALSSFSKILAQTISDAQRLSSLGVTKLQVMGNLKYEIEPAPDLLKLGMTMRENLRNEFADQRVVVLFAISREGEEKLLLDLWRKVDHSQLLLVVVPRHPERFDDVAALAAERGLHVVRRSQSPSLQQLSQATMLLGDTMGEMPFYYAFSDIAILGGSLLNFGGQNLIESLACGCPMVVGPSTYNFMQATVDAQQTGAAVQVENFQQAIDRAIALARSPAERLPMVQAGLQMIKSHQGATSNVLQSVEQILLSDRLH
jgi:3-deoxy-D-manno-octulosonic-acid transferase